MIIKHRKARPGAKREVKLPKIQRMYLKKSLSPSPINIRSKTPVFSPKSPNLDSYFQDFDRVLSKNNVIRKNWILAKEKLIDIEVSQKLNLLSPIIANKSEIFKLSN